MSPKPDVTMYTASYCGYCVRAERLLDAKGVTNVTRIRVDEEPAERIAMMKRTGRRTIPQIYIGDFHVGGYDELAALDRAGALRACSREKRRNARGLRRMLG